MAKASGIPPGVKKGFTIGDLTFYLLYGEWYVRRKSSMNKKKLMKPRFWRFRASTKALALASPIAGALYRLLAKGQDREIYYEMLRQAKALAKQEIEPEFIAEELKEFWVGQLTNYSFEESGTARKKRKKRKVKRETLSGIFSGNVIAMQNPMILQVITKWNNKIEISGKPLVEEMPVVVEAVEKMEVEKLSELYAVVEIIEPSVAEAVTQLPVMVDVEELTKRDYEEEMLEVPIPGVQDEDPVDQLLSVFENRMMVTPDKLTEMPVVTRSHFSPAIAASQMTGTTFKTDEAFVHKIMPINCVADYFSTPAYITVPPMRSVVKLGLYSDVSGDKRHHNKKLRSKGLHRFQTEGEPNKVKIDCAKSSDGDGWRQ